MAAAAGGPRMPDPFIDTTRLRVRLLVRAWFSTSGGGAAGRGGSSGRLADRTPATLRSASIPLIRGGSSTARRSGGSVGFDARSSSTPAVLVPAGPVDAPADGSPTARRGRCGPARRARSGPMRRHADLDAARVGPGAAVVLARQRRVVAPRDCRAAPRAQRSVPRAATRAAMARRPARQLPPIPHRHLRWSCLGLWRRPCGTTGDRSSRAAPQQPAPPAGLAVLRRATRVGSVPAGPPTWRGRRGGVPAAGACAVAGPRPGRRQPTARRSR